jgi:hypothetical protein
MSTLNVRQRLALVYAASKAAGDRDLRAAQAHMHASSSTPNLQRHGERGAAVVLMLIVGLAIFAWAASGGFR